MLDPHQAQALLAGVVAAGKKLKGAEVLASLTSGRTANTRFAKNRITSTGDVNETTLTVEVAFGRRHADVTTNQVDAASLADTVERAARLARLSPEDPEWMPLLGPQKYPTVKAAWDEATVKAGASERASAAADAIAAAEAAGLEIAGYYEHGAGARAIASSAGLSAYHKSTRVDVSMTARTADGMGSGWGQGFANQIAAVQPKTVAGVAIDKATRSHKAGKLEPGRYTVILEPAAAAELLGFLVRSLDARRADERRSFFAKPGGGSKVGDKLFPDAVTLKSDPADAGNPGAPFDGGGLPLGPMTWIDKGTLAALAYSRYWADKQGKQPTGAPASWSLAGGSASAGDLVKAVKRGVLITRFWYTRPVDPQTILITGLTRDGVFLIENGAVTGPVNNFRFNESPVTLLKNMQLMSRETVRVDDGVRVPAILSDGFNLASVSDAV